MGPSDATHRRTVGYLLIGLGALLILVGIGLTIWQFWILANSPRQKFPVRGLTASPYSVSVQTTYIGVILIVISALLAMTGALLFRAPRRGQNSK